MTRGKKSIAVMEWCNDYHCCGDCGLRGHGYQHAQPHKLASSQRHAVLDAFDALESECQKVHKDSANKVRKQAKDSL